MAILQLHASLSLTLLNEQAFVATSFQFNARVYFFLPVALISKARPNSNGIAAVTKTKMNAVFQSPTLSAATSA